MSVQVLFRGIEAVGVLMLSPEIMPLPGPKVYE